MVGDKTHYIRDFGPYLPESHLNICDPHTFADIMYFADCVAATTRPISNASQTCHDVEIIEKGILAASTGQIQMINTVISETK